jgi:hypothetical protein
MLHSASHSFCFIINATLTYNKHCVISGFSRGEDEVFALLVCYGTYVASCLPTTWGHPIGPIFRG